MVYRRMFDFKTKVEGIVPQHPARALCVQRILAARETPGSSANQ
ncbi:hypothetical protein L798_14311 [Zootermopsis nevadensis]|uniref:Uncharacterized protein n=1 Tax=Zootermopsis nevadensis TaxID=136037 RepID=A0A067QPZ5_ZOONE|nr:hypothetical protein L798_14311 [Zootermopsis nevadensis]